MSDVVSAPDEKVRARYKIEIHFGKNRTSAGPNVCAVSAYESGTRLNGEGDEMMYMCSERDRGLELGSATPKVKDHSVERGTDGCGAFIPGSRLRGGFAMCDSCKRVIRADALTNTVLVSLPTKRLGAMVAAWFRKLDSDCDIYLKYHPSDIRYQAMENAEGLDKARMLRGLSIYPLANIIKDTAAGATLEARFAAFLAS
ncbi:MAG: hypothetical protein ACO32I_01220 [Candidatus Limnocylindrus sp.]|jgi:hypothetical protein